MELKEYQREAVRFLRRKKKAVLEMGCRTGKSACALLAKTPITIVVGPPGLKIGWEKETLKWSDRKICYVSAFDKKGITSLQHEFAKRGCEFTVIVDEAHRFMKWSTGQELIKLCKNADRVYMLTATPLYNAPFDIYWMLKLCGNMKLNANDFKLRFCKGKPLYSNKNIIVPTGVSNTEEFKKLKKECFYTYRRDTKLKIKYYDLGKAPLNQDVKFSSYAVVMSMLAILKSDKKKMLKLFKKELKKEDNKKIVVFYRHDHLGEMYHRLCVSEKTNAMLINGKTNFKKRYKIIERFKKAKNKSVIVANVKSLGEGVDIEGTDVVMFLEKNWSFAGDYQAYMRCYGHIRKKPLKVVYFCYTNEGTLAVSKRKEREFKELK